MSVIKFTSTKLNASGKKGIVTPDSDGYYELIIGGLNVYNSIGEYYSLKGAKELFEQSSIFMRRIQNGNLKGETGHPKMLPGMSMNEYIDRMMKIEETNVCVHFKEVWLDEDYGKNRPDLGNKDLVAIMAKIKPVGPNGPALKEALDNPDQNVCFSVRGLTDDYYRNGKTIRVLRKIMCYDWVTEPGIHVSNKFDSPSLEGLEDVMVTKSHIKQILTKSLDSIATEDSRLLAMDTLELFESSKPGKPIYSKW